MPSFTERLSADNTFSTISSSINDCELKLKKISRELSMAIQKCDTEKQSLLLPQQRNIREQLDHCSSSLLELYQQVILDPFELERLAGLQRELHIQKKQLEIYELELERLIQLKPVGPIASLVIYKQPFPMIISKNKPLTEDQLSVKLLTGCGSVVSPLSGVKANLVCDYKGSLPFQPMENDSSNLTSPRLARFPLKFVCGTRRSFASVKMTTSVQSGSSSWNIESELSNPFIVIASANHWEISAGSLLKRDAFGDKCEIPWPQFANTLQKHFLHATRQDLEHLKRPLSPMDFSYIHSHFFSNRNMISQREFDSFWSSFSKNLFLLRYQQSIGSMWKDGVIYGFMTREGTNTHLQSQTSGAFIIRFSESKPGLLAIAYRAEDHKVNHLLLSPEDCSFARKTLAEFIAECPKLSYLRQLTTFSFNDQCFVKAQKSIALKPFLVKKNENERCLHESF